MLALLIAASLQAAPDAATRDSQRSLALGAARSAWMACLDGAAGKWASRPEDPLTLAAGALGACQREEAAFRDAAEMITRVITPDPIGDVMDRERAHARERVVARILTLRTASPPPRR